MNSSNLEVFVPPKNPSNWREICTASQFWLNSCLKLTLRHKMMGKSRCVVRWSREAKKNQKPYYAGSWVFSEQGGGRIVIRLSLSRSSSSITKYYIYTHRRIEEKTAEKSDNKSIWNWYINRGTKSVSMGEMCVTWHFLLGWVDDMNRSLDPYSGLLLTSKWPLLPFDSGMLLYHNEWDRRLTLFVEKRHNVWKTFMMILLRSQCLKITKKVSFSLIILASYL